MMYGIVRMTLPDGVLPGVAEEKEQDSDSNSMADVGIMRKK